MPSSYRLRIFWRLRKELKRRLSLTALIAGALVALLVVQLVFWLMTQPVNKHWLQEVELTAPAKRFFATEGSGGAPLPPTEELTALRNRWELSHAIRAALAMLSLILLTAAIAISSV